MTRPAAARTAADRDEDQSHAADGPADHFDRAGRLLKDRQPHDLSITDAVSVNGSLELQLMATNVDRVDVYIDQRPRASVDLTNGQANVTVPDAATARSARVEGFEAGQLVASKTEQLN
ncbi:hypothetical protein [Streptomyces spongiae]|uniref:hypothetical protein n=1 Tax=Streptomyces spongiae TaxID=565072 RepID=UPI0018835A54|nr:hypothetical protein [Streptomyces spongiae]